MKSKVLNRIVAVTMAVTLVFSNTTAADSWHQQGDDWFVLSDRGMTEGENIEYRTGWYQDQNKDWYYLDASPNAPIKGALQSGWLFEGMNWYFLNPIHDGYYGRAFTNTWLWIDGYCYYFDENGKMASNGTTLDMYTVDQDGRWTVDGVVQYIPGKGILTKSAQFTSGISGGGTRSGGGGGGSSGGSGGGNSSNNNSGNNNEDQGEDIGQSIALTVVYMDADTNDVLDTIKFDGKSGEKIQIEHRKFGGYEILDNQPIEASFAAKDATIYILYRKTLFVGDIEIQYVNIENSQLITSRTVSGLVGEDYIVHIPAIDNYKAITEQDFTIRFSSNKQIAKVEYRPIRNDEKIDQKLVTADNVKIAQADTAKEKEVLNQIYDGIFDYQQYEDGTIELTVYNSNPILQYTLDGKYIANDVIYIEPNDDFAAGLTFIYQSHDDDYSGIIEGYESDKCEVIHGYQASPFSLFAPGTNLEIEIPMLSSANTESQAEWSLFEDTQTDSPELMTMSNRANTLSTLIKLNLAQFTKKDLMKKLKGSVKTFIDKYINDFNNNTSASLSVQNLVLKIYIPLVNNSDEAIVQDKIYEFQMSPIFTIKNETNVKLASADSNKIQEALNSMVKDELSTVPTNGLSDQQKKKNRTNAVQFGNLFGNFWIQGIDFEGKGIIPFAAQGVNLATKQFSTKVSDLISPDMNETVSLKSLKVYIGLVECVVFNPEGSAEINNVASLNIKDFTMGVRFTESNGEYQFTNLTTAPVFTIENELTGELKISGKVGVCLMAVASVAGVVPIGIGPEAGLKFENTQAKLESTLRVGTDGNHTWDTVANFDGNIAFYTSIEMHSRIAMGAGNTDKPYIEILPIDQTMINKEWPLIGIESDESTITIQDEKDEFKLCDSNGKDLNITVSPIWDQIAGGWRFTCPEYILKEVNGKQKVCKVTKLIVTPTEEVEKNSWVYLELPSTLTELNVSAILSKNFRTNYPTNLNKIKFTGANSEYDYIDISQCKALTSLNVQGTAITNLDVSGNLMLTDLIINSKLKEFTGNGIVMPDKLTWFADTEAKTEPITSCKRGQTIYSGTIQNEPIENQDTLEINDPATIKYQVLDEYGNDISSTWPGYNESTGMVSPVLNTSTGMYSVKAPQYVQIKEGENEKTFKVISLHLGLHNNINYSELDCSNAPDISILSMTTDYTGTAPEKIILPKNLLQFNCLMPGNGNFNCDFSLAPDLYSFNLVWGDSRDHSPLNLDLKKNMKLKRFIFSTGRTDLTIKLPDTDLLEEINISRLGGTENLREIDFSQYPNLKRLVLYNSNISILDLSVQKKLEYLSLMEMPISELDLSNNPLLSELFISKLSIKHLDISHNDNLSTLRTESTSVQGLETFIGNGKVVPDWFTWFSDKEKTNEVKTCTKGQILYSNIYKNPANTVLEIREKPEYKDMVSTPSVATRSDALRASGNMQINKANKKTGKLVTLKLNK